MEMIRDQIKGLRESLKELRARERLFIKNQTLLEQIEKARAGQDKLSKELEEVKARKTALKKERAEMLKGACAPLAESISVILPHGKAIVTLEDELSIGWEHEGKISPYQGLSGGEKVFFDAGLSNALLKGSKHKVLIVEAAEEDEANLMGMLAAISKSNPDTQIIVNTWLDPATVPEGWEKVRLG